MEIHLDRPNESNATAVSLPIIRKRELAISGIQLGLLFAQFLTRKRPKANAIVTEVGNVLDQFTHLPREDENILVKLSQDRNAKAQSG